MSSAQDQNRPHIAVLFPRIGPYHYARLKAAGLRLRLTAIEFSDVDATYAWDVVAGAESFTRLNLFSGEAMNDLSARRISARVYEVLEQLQPQLVAIPGWADRCSLATLRWCLAHAIPAVVMSETTAWDDDRKWWKEAVKRRLLGLFSAALAGGRPHADYLAQLGFAPDRIFLGYDAVDNAYFEVKSAASRKQGAVARKQFGLPKKFFLASARFIKKKNLLQLIRSYARFRQLASNAGPRGATADFWQLVLLGDGPLKADIGELIAELSLQDSILLPGFKQYDELPAYYGLATAFVHPSTTEQWGLVVNEAMASGLPVLVSRRCGCAQDLVQEGVNGFAFDPYDVEALAGLMLRISARDFPLSKFGSASQELVSHWGPERFADGLVKAAAMASSAPAPRLGLCDRLLFQLLMMR